MRRLWLVPLVLVLGYGVALASVAIVKPASPLMKEEAKETRREVLKRVPLGSPADTARAVMTAERFVCTQMTGQPFSVSDPDGPGVTAHAAADFLWCDSGKLGVGLTKRWQVMLVDRGGLVSSVYVSVDMGGP